MNRLSSSDDNFENRLRDLRPAENLISENQVQFRCGFEAGYQQALVDLNCAKHPDLKRWMGMAIAATLLSACVGFGAYKYGKSATYSAAMIAQSTDIVAENSSEIATADKDQGVTPEIFLEVTENSSPPTSISSFWWLSLPVFGLSESDPVESSLFPMTVGSSLQLRRSTPGEAPESMLAKAWLSGAEMTSGADRGLIDAGTKRTPYSIRMSGDAWNDLLQSL